MSVTENEMKEYYEQKLKLARLELEMIDEKIIEKAHQMTANALPAVVDKVFERIEDYREIRDEIKAQITYYTEQLKLCDTPKNGTPEACTTDN